MKNLSVFGLSVMAMLGDTSALGAVQHGNDPTMSVALAIVCMSAILLITIPRKGN